MFNRMLIMTIAILVALTILPACRQSAAPVETVVVEKEAVKEVEAPATDKADLTAVKDYAIEHANKMKAGSEAFRQGAEEYYTVIAQIKEEHPDENPYKHLWEENPEEAAAIVEQLKADWLETSLQYELNEGIVAGVPSLAYYDGWIDAGPSGTDDPEEAIEWTLKLADGRVLESPGNFFHHLTEPTLYGTVDEYVGLRVDLNGDGEIGLGEVLPEAEILLASAQGLDEATGQMQEAIHTWEPTLDDAFMALVTMIPTMNEYFEQWKFSSFIAGEGHKEIGFIAVSRLSDINSILNGLHVTYSKIRPVVATADAEMDKQIDNGFDDLVSYVGNLYNQEQAGTTFTPEEADEYGTEAQNKATALAGQVAQAAAKVGINLAEEPEGWEPDSPPVITAQAP